MAITILQEPPAISFVGNPLIHRFGSYRVIGFGIALILAGTLLRAVGPNAAVILLMTLPIGIGVALVGVALPVEVKIHFPDRPGAVTGAYVASLSVAIAIIGVALVPLADTLGGWRPAFALTAVPAAVALVVWGAVMRRRAPSPSGKADAGPPRFGYPGRGTALLAAILAMQTLAFSAMMSWMPTVYKTGGWSEHTAGVSTSVIGLMTIFGALIVAGLSSAGNRRLWLAATLAIQGVGIIGLALFGVTAGWLWVLLFGLGNGASFAVLLVLPIDTSTDTRGVADVSMWMLGIGFMVASTGSLLTGALRDLTAGFTTALLILAAISMISAVAGLFVPARITRRRPAGQRLAYGDQ